jgi:xanthine/uracil/vitamin C permease (AzgA family)
MVKRAKRARQSAKSAAPGGYQRQIVPMLYKNFGLKEQGTDIRTEFIAGITTFLTMVYIVFVNPAILSKTGMDQGAVFVATCVAAAVSRPRASRRPRKPAPPRLVLAVLFAIKFALTD